MSSGIIAHDRVAITISIHIVAKNTLTSGHIIVGIDKSTNFRIIIPGVQEIHPKLSVEIISTIAQRVDLCQVACCGQNVAVGIIGIRRYDGSAGVYQTHDIALQIEDVIVGSAVKDQGKRSAVFVVQEVQGIIAVEDIAVTINIFLDGFAVLPL